MKIIRNEKKEIMLSIFNGESDSLGAIKIQKLLKERFDLDMSLSSVGRILIQLEEDGYIRRGEQRGRYITEKGRDQVRKLELITRTTHFQSTIEAQIKEAGAQGFINYYLARKCIEIEAIRITVNKITDSEIEQLHSQLIDEIEYYQSIQPGLFTVETAQQLGEHDYHFHKNILKISKNPYFELFFDMIDSTCNKQIIYGYIRGQRIEEHIKIFQALKLRDVNGAMKAMENHLTEGLSVEKYENYWENRNIIDSLLTAGKFNENDSRTLNREKKS